MVLSDPPRLSYNTYNYAAYVAPIVVLGVSLVFMLVSIYTIILICWPFRKGFKKFADKEIPPELLSRFSEKGNPIPCWTFIFGGLKLIYGHELDECKHSHKTNAYTICGRHVRPWLLAVLFMVVAFVCSCTVVAFWCEFLVSEGDHCNAHMDCFAKNASHALVSNMPLSNDECWDYESRNYTIHCFKFSLDYAGALGAAGGVLVLASVIMNVQAGLWIGASSQEGKWAWRLAVGGVTALNALVGAALVATPIVVQLVPFLREKITGTDRDAARFYTYWATFLSAFTISGPIFIVFSKRLRRETMVDGVEQYISTVNSNGKDRSRSKEMNNSVAGSDASDAEGLDLSDWHQQIRYGSV